jgi:hypothetical protein
MDGYLGYVTPPNPALKAVVDDINLKRRAVYSEKAQAQKATVGICVHLGLPADRPDAAGEKYQAPNGTWQTRTSARRSAIALPVKSFVGRGLNPACRRIDANVCAQLWQVRRTAVDSGKPPPKGQAPSAGCRCA